MQQYNPIDSHLASQSTSMSRLAEQNRPRLRVLLFEHDSADAELIKRHLLHNSKGYCHVQLASRFAEATAQLESRSFDVVLADVSVPGSDDLNVIETIHELAPRTAVIVLTGMEDTFLGTEAVKNGAQDYVIKCEKSYASLWRTIRYAVERERMKSCLDDALDKLEHENEATHQVLNQLRIATLVIDSDESIAFASDAAVQLLGLASNAAVVGESWRHVLPGDANHHALIERSLRTTNRPLARIPIHWADTLDVTKHIEIEIVPCPVRPERMFLHLHDLTELQNLRQELKNKQSIKMVGESKIMRALYRQIQAVAGVDWTVLIEGETGVGKELVARSIHHTSRRSDSPFIAINCAALTESLLNSQLFGHRRGAFTGAMNDREGVFESASGGTLFLDEIGDLPLSMQTSLLRVLQEKEIVRIGDSRPRKIDVRVVAATHRNLAEQVEKGQFRADLLFRLKVGRISVPPLRDRKEDIPALTASFLASGRAESGKPISRVADDTMQIMLSYDWPGNVRELKNTVDFAIICCTSGDTLWPEHLPPELTDKPRSSLPSQTKDPFDGTDNERSRIEAALRAAGGNRNRAAKLLGMSRATLYRRLDTFGIGPKFPK